jgi:hypothetical protein
MVFRERIGVYSTESSGQNAEILDVFFSGLCNITFSLSRLISSDGKKNNEIERIWKVVALI